MEASEDPIISISITPFSVLLTSAAELGALQVLIELGYVSRYMYIKEAIEKYGKEIYYEWRSEGLVIPVIGTAWNARFKIDRLEIAIVAMASQSQRHLHIDEIWRAAK